MSNPPESNPHDPATPDDLVRPGHSDASPALDPTVELGGSRDTDPTVQVDPDATVAMGEPSGPSPFRGMVLAAGSGHPVEGASVEVAAADGQIVGRAVTVADGRFTVAQLAAGTYRLSVTSESFFAARQEFTHPGARLQIDLRPTRLTGTVTAADSGPGERVFAEVVARDLDGHVRSRTTTDVAGGFALDGLTAGSYVVEVSAESYFTTRAEVRVDAGVAPMDVVLVPAELEGQVVADPSREPVLDAQVKLRTIDGKLAGQSVTDPAGRFLIPLAGLTPPTGGSTGISAATHHLDVTADGFEPASVELTLTDEPADRHVVVLHPVKRSPWLWVGLGAGAIALIALLFWYFSTSTVIVPELLGSTVEEADVLLTDAELVLGEVDTIVSDADPGTIVEQSEAAGSEVGADTAIDVTVAASEGTVAVPNLLGMRRSAAERALEEAGLVVGLVDTRPSAETPEGRVVDADPVAGEIVEPGTEVDLTLAAAAEDDPSIEVPRVVGRQEADALRLLDAGGFEVVISRVTDDEPAGIVIGQDPAARTEVTEGATVTLEVSQGPAASDPEPDPDPQPDPDPDPGDGDTDGDGSGFPEIDLPEIDLPEIDLPEIDTDGIAGFFERILDRIRSLFDR